MKGLASLIIVWCFVIWAAIGCSSSLGEGDKMGITAPELPKSFSWIKTPKPLRIHEDLKGHVVLLDFWTYCCINCMHILPDLEHLEDKYSDQPFVVVGVHSNKFENEGDPENIRTAMQRYDIEHPVVVDRGMRIWQEYNVHSWPTLVLIDSRGKIRRWFTGEGNREALDKAIGKLLEEGRKNGTLAEKRIEIPETGEVRPASGLAFPGKVLADVAGNRVFIADSNHNRIVVTGWPDEKGRASLIGIIGSGEEGQADGAFSEATFHNPQGLALQGATLYVADTDNHLIRAVDLDTQNVQTIAGTGKQEYDRRGGRKGTDQPLNSPWDVAVKGETLYIAMAGPHQIWSMDLDSRVVKALAGSGIEDLRDGPFPDARLAQTSGLALKGDDLYFADSEVSALRKADLDLQVVTTLIGRGLFYFGDRDGSFEEARLQHPLGVAVHDNDILIADTYNHKVKRASLEKKTVETLFGLGKPATGDPGGKVGFYEPGGLSAAGDTLFVADTNNHRVVVIDLKTNEWREMMIEGLEPPQDQERTPETTENVATLATAKIAPDQPLKLTIKPPIADNTEFNDDFPVSVRISVGKKAVYQKTFSTKKTPLEVELATDAVSEALAHDGPWRINVSYAVCTKDESALCIPKTITFEIPISGEEGGESAITIEKP